MKNNNKEALHKDELILFCIDYYARCKHIYMKNILLKIFLYAIYDHI
jgi:hypothetical protein